MRATVNLILGGLRTEHLLVRCDGVTIFVEQVATWCVVPSAPVPALRHELRMLHSHSLLGKMAPPFPPWSPTPRERADEEKGDEALD